MATDDPDNARRQLPQTLAGADIIFDMEDDDEEELDEDDGDCAFCLGREAAHRGEGEDQNPFRKTAAHKGSAEWFDTDYRLWLAGHGVVLTSRAACRGTPNPTVVMKIGNDLRTEGLHMTGPADPTDLRAHFLAGRAEAERLQPRAMMIGYNVGVTTGGELGQVPTTTFQVWRIDDLEHENERTFETPQDVEEHLDYLESLPLFALDLAGDPEVRELTDERGAVTVTDDQGTPVNVAMMRIQDLEASQRLFIRAEQEDRPTVGSSREVE